jgi:hypothetical protein
MSYSFTINLNVYKICSNIIKKKHPEFVSWTFVAFLELMLRLLHGVYNHTIDIANQRNIIFYILSKSVKLCHVQSLIDVLTHPCLVPQNYSRYLKIQQNSSTDRLYQHFFYSLITCFNGPPWLLHDELNNSEIRLEKKSTTFNKHKKPIHPLIHLDHIKYSSLPLKYASWTYTVCAYLTDRCVL